MPTRKQQWVGCLLGQALGDALGAPAEKQSATAARLHAALLALPPADRRRALKRMGVGQYTDGAQLARELLLSYTHMSSYSTDDYAGNLAELVRSERLVGGGKATKGAAQRLLAGLSPPDTADPQALGNGSAERAGPLGLIFAGDFARAEAARSQSLITHKLPACTGGAVAVASAVFHATATAPMTADDFLERVAADAKPFDRPTAAAILSVRGCLDVGPGDAYNYLRALHIPEWEGWEGIPPHVTSTVLWALYAFLRSPDDYMEVIRTAISVGGDVDSTAGIAGAFAGAAPGVEGLPGELLDLLSDRGLWAAEELAALAAEACRIAFPGG